MDGWLQGATGWDLQDVEAGCDWKERWGGSAYVLAWNLDDPDNCSVTQVIFFQFVKTYMLMA